MPLSPPSPVARVHYFAGFGFFIDGHVLSQRFLQVHMTKHHVQGQACVRYIAHKHSLLGTTLEDCARVEMVAEACRDLRMPGVQFPFSTLSEDDRLSGISTQISKTCPGIARMFAAGGADVFLCQGGITYADVMLAEAMQMLLTRVGPAPFEPFPRLLAVHSQVTQMPSIAHYLSSALRLKPDDATYSKLVNYVLGRGPK